MMSLVCFLKPPKGKKMAALYKNAEKWETSSYLKNFKKTKFRRNITKDQ